MFACLVFYGRLYQFPTTWVTGQMLDAQTCFQARQELQVAILSSCFTVLAEDKLAIWSLNAGLSTLCTTGVEVARVSLGLR